MNIIVFGTGSYAENILYSINKNIKIKFASDNDSGKWWKQWHGLTILPPYKLKDSQFDYIIIASMYTEEIVDGLLDLGLDVRKLICVYDGYYSHHKHYEIINEIFNTMDINKILLVSNDNSGCNSRALFKQIPEYITKKFEVELIEGNHMDRINSSKVCVTTHYNFGFYPQTINIDLWHGFPLKVMGIMDKHHNIQRKHFYDTLSKNVSYDTLSKNVSFCISYSNLYTYLMSSCSGIKADKFKITGAPRNDLLVNKNSRSLLEKILNKNLQNRRIIFYVPTFRKRRDSNGFIIHDGKNIEENLTDIKKLNDFFEEKDIVFIIKRHAFTSDMWHMDESKNMLFITNEVLNNHDIDFYEILGASDMLITDYSSVYFDYLLLDRPIIFFVKDYEEYRDKRGFLLEPFEFWTPGPKVFTYEMLKREIETFFTNKDYYSREREQIKNIVHFYKDFNSRQRVWKEIHNYINNIT